MADLAIVGAGIGGCSAAYFARQYLSNINITIYDSQNRIGGRILTYKESGVKIELGAAFFNGFNKTLLGIIDAERLRIAPIEDSKNFAVWNGSKIIFRSSKKSFATTSRLLARYRLSLVRTFLLLRNARRQVAKLYQEELKNPTDISDLFESVGLNQWYENSFLEELIARGVSSAFIDEVITPLTRIIYSQNGDLGGLAGVSALIGVYSGPTYSMVEGNSSLPVYLANASKAAVKLGQKVDKIEKTSSGTYRLYSNNEEAVFDSVIMATPIELADIEFDGLSSHVAKPQPYQMVHIRIMRGIVDPNFFGLKESAEPPAIVLTTKDADPITNFSIQKVNKGESLVTISSPKPVNPNVVNEVFKNEGVTVLEHVWKAAYPVFKPLTKLPSTRIDKRFMYVNAVEPSVSSMETSTLSGLNAIRLLAKED
jgi:prenylcysteine oxidase / farnesylcysteine lyase